MSKQWFVVHAYSNYEMKVRAALEERIERLDLDEFFGEILIPTE
ncbi:MAG: transcription termination/antitermination NusG family protein, partial [Cocleimonas sp.]